MLGLKEAQGWVLDSGYRGFKGGGIHILYIWGRGRVRERQMRWDYDLDLGRFRDGVGFR